MRGLNSWRIRLQGRRGRVKGKDVLPDAGTMMNGPGVQELPRRSGSL